MHREISKEYSKPTAILVQNNYVERITVPVAKYARENGVELVDRSSSAEFDPDNCGHDWSSYGHVIIYGSVQFLRKCKNSSLSRFVQHDEELFSTKTYAPILGHHALNHAGRLVTVQDILENFGSERIHLRPDRVDKAFTGSVHTHKSFLALANDRERPLAPDLLCWASPVLRIDAEWRCWILHGRVVEISQYRKDGRMDYKREIHQEIFAIAVDLSNRYLPAPCVVMDIALTDDGYSVIEYNPIHSSGWYAADVSTVLDAWIS